MISTNLKRNTILLYISYISRYLFPIFLIPYLTRVLGFESWGNLIFYIAYAAYVEAIIEYRFDITGTRDISVHRDSRKKREEILSTVMTSKILLSALCLIVTLLLTLVFESLQQDIEIFVGLTIVSIVSNFSMFWYFKGIEDMKMVSYLTTTSYFVSSILVFLFIKTPNDVILYPLFFFCSALLISGIGLYNVYTKNSFYFSSVSKAVNGLIDNFRMLLVRASGLFLINGNIICVSLIYSNRLSASFALAIKIAHSIRMLLTPIVDATFPNISSLIKANEDEAKRVLISVSKILLFLSVGMTLSIFFTSNLLITFFAGIDDPSAISMLKVFSALPIIVAVTHIFGPLWMVPIGEDVEYTKMFYIGVTVNLFLLLASTYLPLSIYWPVSIVLVSQLVIPVLMYMKLKEKHQLFYT